MKFSVAASPKDENELEEFTFVFVPELIALRFVAFRRYVRGCETSPWELRALWQYPNIPEASTVEQPPVPDWARVDAKIHFMQHISFQQTE